MLAGLAIASLGIRQREIMSAPLTRNRRMVLAEFEQLLNLVFSNSSSAKRVNWREDPFHSAIRSFIRDSTAIVPPKELIVHCRNEWLHKRGTSLDRLAIQGFESLSLEILNGRV